MPTPYNHDEHNEPDRDHGRDRHDGCCWDEDQTPGISVHGLTAADLDDLVLMFDFETGRLTRRAPTPHL